MHVEPAEPSIKSRSLDVLVVEDTIAGQNLLAGILHGAGHRVRLAGNGVQALRAFFQRRPELIVIDLQMPVLDGLNTIGILRLVEDESDRVGLIVATADRDPEARDRCLAAGADAFLAKPPAAPALLQALVELGAMARARRARTSPDAPLAGRGSTIEGEAVIDLQAALARLGGDTALLVDLIGFFLEDFPGLVLSARKGLQQGDWKRVQHAVHSLKGLTANFDAAPSVRALQACESSCAQRDSHVTSQLQHEAERQIARVVEALVEQYETIAGH